ncbi:uncharacterized protein [Euphorbia lathyris]|uniref:uncharacterized protein isoform X2 n=1 Tax=Euphorbia lathyris TaxID=212925 RepID=UPI003313FE55
MLIITSSSSLSIPQYPLSNPIFLLRNSQFLQISSRPTFLKLQHGNNNKICSRYMAVHAGVDPGSVVPPDPSSIPWKFWIVGMLITAILPFWNKFWPLTKLKDRVDSIVENVEEVAEGIENVAEGIDKVAEELADHLPEGGRLQKAAMFVEDAAEQAAKNAHLLDQFIDKSDLHAHERRQGELVREADARVGHVYQERNDHWSGMMRRETEGRLAVKERACDESIRRLAAEERARAADERARVSDERARVSDERARAAEKTLSAERASHLRDFENYWDFPPY